MRRAGLLFAGLTCVAQLASASSIFTFAQFSASGNVFQFINNGASGIFQTTAGPGGTVPVTFNYNGVAGLPAALQGNLSALVQVNMPTTQGANSIMITPSYYFTTQGFDEAGSITFTLPTPITSGVPGCTLANPCSNLLTVNITQLDTGFTGQRGAKTDNLSGDVASNPTDQFAFTSDFLVFPSQAGDDLSLTFTSVSPCYTRAADGSCTTGSLTPANTLALLHSNTESGTGGFASAPVFVGMVPEPVTMVLTGSALIGLAVFMRRKRSRV